MTSRKEKAAVVWRFVDYEARFGTGAARMPVEVPKFVKWPINAWDGPEGDVLRAMTVLRLEKKFIELQGAVVELLSISTNTSKAYRGVLLTSRKEPATIAEIGSMLRIEGRGQHARTTAVLKRMEKAGFLEQVPWPPPVDSGDIEDIKDLLGKAKDGAPKKKKGGQKSRKRPKNEAKPLRRGKPPTEENSRRGPPRTAAQERVWEAAQRERLKPAQTPRRLSDPTTPTRSDGRAGPGKTPAGRMACPPSITPAEADVIPIGAVLDGRRHRYSAAAADFAERVLAASGYVSFDADEAACERAHWTKAFDRDGAVLSPAAFAKVRRKVLAKAAGLRADRHAKDNPESWLMTVWQNEVKDRLRARQGVG